MLLLLFSGVTHARMELHFTPNSQDHSKERQTNILFLPKHKYNQHASLDDVILRHESTLRDVLGKLPHQFLQACHASLCRFHF